MTYAMTYYAHVFIATDCPRLIGAAYDIQQALIKAADRGADRLVTGSGIELPVYYPGQEDALQRYANQPQHANWLTS